MGDAAGALAQIWAHYENGLHARYARGGRSLGLGGLRANTASSVWVKEGYRLRLWDGSGRTGDSATLYGGYTNLAYWTFNDAANDVDVESVAPCTLFSNDRGRGSGNAQWFDAANVDEGYHSTNLGAMNDNTESVYVAPGYKCTVWADNFEGKSLTLYPGWHLWHELNHEGMVNKISSVRAEDAPSGYEELAENALALAWESYQGHSGGMQVYDSEGESLGVADAGGINKISSVWVKEGYRLRLWDGSGRTGDSVTLFGGYTNLAYWTFNNGADDVDVERVAPCTLFRDDRGRGAGNAQWFDATEVGRYYTRDALLGLDNRVDSIYVAPGYKCTVWEDYSEGHARTFHPGLHLHHDVSYAGLNDKASAVLVERLDASGEERGCYPATGKRMVFPGNANDVSHRVDVYPDGRVHNVASGTQRHLWTSIANLAYAVEGRRTLALAAEWTQYDGGYALPEFSCAENVVSLGGMVKRSQGSPSSGDTIAHLPEGCRPSGSLDFTVRSGSSTGISQIMIDKDGNVEFHGEWGSNWLSLHGITFTFGAVQKTLDLHHAWYNFNNGLQPLQYSCEGNLVTVSGRVAAGTWGSCIAYLPPECRPSDALLFTVSNGNLQARVNVKTDGCIEWASGGRSHGWLSLSGIAFTTGLKERLDLDRWRNYGGSGRTPNIRAREAASLFTKASSCHTIGTVACLTCPRVLRLRVSTSPTRVDSCSIRIRMNTCSAWTGSKMVKFSSPAAMRISNSRVSPAFMMRTMARTRR